MQTTQEIEILGDRLIQGDRFALSKAITVVESAKSTDQQVTMDLILRCTKVQRGASRIAVSGAPGVGKSSFIEALGMMLIKQGHRVAVLAIDPSSQDSKGSIMGDKTRMPALGRSDNAFVRPSPSAGQTGGLGLATYESSLLCEAAGYDIILIETVGVGQSEIAARHTSDLLVLLLQPGAGDDLQGLKRGLVEEADLLIVTKHDGDLKNAAGITRQQYASVKAMRSQHREDAGRVLTCSVFEQEGFQEVWLEMQRLLDKTDKTMKRNKREKHWFREKIKTLMMLSFLNKYREPLTNYQSQIDSGALHYLEAVQSFTASHNFFK